MAALAAAVLLLLLLAPPIATRVIAGRLRAVASARGLDASWRTLRWGWSGRLRIDSLALTDAAGDTLASARSATVGIAPLSLLELHPRPSLVMLDDGRVRLRARHAVEPDTLADDVPEAPERPSKTANPERARRLKRSAEQAIRMLFLPARNLPRVMITRLSVMPAANEDALIQGVEIDTFRVDPSATRTQLRARGTIRSDHDIPFQLAFGYGADDRLAGSARFLIPDEKRRSLDTLAFHIDGRVRQDPGAGVVQLGDATRVEIGSLPLSISGSVWRRGPRLELDLGADRVDEDQVHAALPPSMLGRLLDVSVRGTFDYRLHFDLDFDRPDSVDFRADVVQHGLRLDSRGTRLNLLTLDAPFPATIHLPRGRVVTRELGPDNPHFRPLDQMDSVLVRAVVTNEDGGFFRHRGFNPEAVKRSIAENIRAGAYRRGAGTITMQLARNLWLGHERTLSRKMQEVVLAWILEHLTGASKQRLLEIYLNIIEWGPEIQGADEAAWYYFGHDAGRITPDEALFLATVIPAPSKWRYRFDSQGELRPFERAQMHFIGRAMAAKGWLDPSLLPPADSLRVSLRGPAHDVLFPPRADSSSVGRSI